MFDSFPNAHSRIAPVRISRDSVVWPVSVRSLYWQRMAAARCGNYRWLAVSFGDADLFTQTIRDLILMPADTSSSAAGPLQGLSVLEFSHTVMGPCAGLLLADLGADVIKVEPPGGDKTRQLTGFASGFYATFNRNKRCIVVDLKSGDGQRLIHKLVANTDIVLDNYGPDTMDRLNCGWQSLKNRNEKLVYLSLKGFLAGPWQSRPALDEVVQFQSGLAYMTGPPGQPLRAGASVIDILGAVFGVTGVLAALRERDATGVGQRVDSALFESAAFLMASHMTGGAATGAEIPPMTARKGAWGIYDVFHASDGTQLFIGVTSDSQWQRFCTHFELHELLADTRLVSNTQRTAEREWLIPKLTEFCASLSYEELLNGCTTADVSWSPVGRPEDLWQSEQLLSTGGLLETALNTARDAVAASTLVPGLPLSFGDDCKRPLLHRQPPEAGQHSREVLAAANFNSAAIDQLIAAGVVE